MIDTPQGSIPESSSSQQFTSGVNEHVAAGPLALFASHRTAANLIMVLMIVAGVTGLIKMNSQFLPSFGIDIITITIEWPGANAEDMDTNIVQLVEPEIRFIDSVKRVRSTSYVGTASIVMEFEAGADMQSSLSSVEAAISRITTLPVDSKKPLIKRIVRYEAITRLVLSGPIPETALKAHAKRFRDELLAKGIDKVTMVGARDQEIWVETQERTLRRMDLKLADIAERIGSISVDLPSGNVGQGLRQVRSLGLLTDAEDFGDMEIKSLDDGRKVYLRDIADVNEAFKDSDVVAFRGGFQAIEIQLMRALDSDALILADKIDEYLKDTLKTLPPNLRVERYDSMINLLDDRINLLVSNALSGLVIVTLILFIFLQASIALWVLIGIPVCFMATLGVMLLTGQSINMISLFGLIMALGIVVDDAIVVGEHAEFQRRRGLGPLAASVAGARRMAAPVVSASLTTISAFLPLILIGGIIGQVISAIPLVIVAVLVASLAECFYVLPGHLTHGMKLELISLKAYDSFRASFDSRFNAFRDGPFRQLVAISISWRYATLAIVVALLFISVGLLVSGRIGFNFFPTPEADKIIANVKMVAGTPRSQTKLMLEEVERAAYIASKKSIGTKENLIKMIIVKLGIPVIANINQPPSSSTDDAVGGIELELLTADKRKIRTSQFIKLWRDEIDPVAGLKNLTIQEIKGGPPGRDVDIRLNGDDINALKAAAVETIKMIERYPGVSDIEDSIPYGKRETIISVNQRGKSLGFTTEIIGRQVRNAIEGIVAKRFARADEEVAVRIMYPRSEITSSVLESLYLRAPNGQEVPLVQVVKTKENFGFASIKREDGNRQIAITADIDSKITSVGEVMRAIKQDGIFEIANRYDLSVDFSGKAEEEQETFADMRLGLVVGLCGIFVVLAWVFASYSKPLVVMAVIPMGFIGAALGHWLLGYNLTILSLVGLIGLSGIIINGSIILVTTIVERNKNEALMDSIVGASCDRFRPIILTSATTVGGLMPLMFEKSMQAQFLIPMAITIVFGLGIATLLILFVVPALVASVDDLARIFRSSAKERVF